MQQLHFLSWGANKHFVPAASKSTPSIRLWTFLGNCSRWGSAWWQGGPSRVVAHHRWLLHLHHPLPPPLHHLGHHGHQVNSRVVHRGWWLIIGDYPKYPPSVPREAMNAHTLDIFPASLSFFWSDLRAQFVPHRSINWLKIHSYIRREPKYFSQQIFWSGWPIFGDKFLFGPICRNLLTFY